MPDDLIPEIQTTEPTQEATVDTAAPAEAESDQLNDAAYDEAMTELLGDTPEEPDGGEDLEDDVTYKAGETPEPADTSTPLVTDGERAVLERAGLKPEMYADWKRGQVDEYVSWARQQQTEGDRHSAEMGRLKQKTDGDGQEQAKSTQPPAVSEFRNSLVDSFGEEINPLLDYVERIETEAAELRGQSGMISMMGQLLNDFATENALSAVAADYPSATKPEMRQKLIERFNVEWSTGAYAKPDRPIRESLVEAMRNAAKVTFMETTEASAAAQLVNKNRDRVKAQPRLGPEQRRRAPVTEDDVYDAAFEENLAPLLNR